MLSDRRQAHACDAAALRTVWSASKLARGDPGLQICRNGQRGSGKDALLWRRWRAIEFFDQAPVHVDQRIRNPQPKQVLRDASPLIPGQDLGTNLPLLRREKANPNSFRFFALTPKSYEIFQVIRSMHHLAGDRAVNRNPGSSDAFQDTFIGGWLTPNIMLRLQSVD